MLNSNVGATKKKPSTQTGSGMAMGFPCRMHSVTVTNLTAGDLWLLVFDAAAVPANGTDPEFPPVKIPAESTGSFDVAGGVPMTNGIAAVMSSDLTVTAVADAGWFLFTYA